MNATDLEFGRCCPVVQAHHWAFSKVVLPLVLGAEAPAAAGGPVAAGGGGGGGAPAPAAAAAAGEEPPALLMAGNEEQARRVGSFCPLASHFAVPCSGGSAPGCAGLGPARSAARAEGGRLLLFLPGRPPRCRHALPRPPEFPEISQNFAKLPKFIGFSRQVELVTQFITGLDESEAGTLFVFFFIFPPSD